MPSEQNLRQHALDIFQAALDAVDPEEAVKCFVQVKGSPLTVDGMDYDLDDFNSITVVGAGKADAPMAAALESLLGEQITNGLLNVKYGHTQPLARIRLNEAGHPVPDENGLKGAKEIVELVETLGEDNLVICLLSGGGSALLPLPAEGISLEDKQEVTKLLLACGANIQEINTVRKHLSAVKGGQLARAAAPATLISLVLSDVIGDQLDAIASGPTVPDTTTFAEVSDLFNRYDLSPKLPAHIIRRIWDGIEEKISDTPKPGEPAFEKTQNVVIGSNPIAVNAAAEKAKLLGYQTLILSTFMEGETREIARAHAAIAKEIHQSGNPVCPPACILSGGETTVTIRGDGKGGRCQEFALAAARDLADLKDTLVLAAGTDGSDGPTDAAGAYADGATIARAEEFGLDASDFLNRNDSYHFFELLEDLLITGPTRTNVCDVRILLVGCPQAS